MSVDVWVCPGPLLLVCKVNGGFRYGTKFWNKLQCFVEQTAESFWPQVGCVLLWLKIWLQAEYSQGWDMFFVDKIKSSIVVIWISHCFLNLACLTVDCQGNAKTRDVEWRRWCVIKKFQKVKMASDGKWELLSVVLSSLFVFSLCSKNEILRASGSPGELWMTILWHSRYSVHSLQYGQFRSSPAWRKCWSLRWGGEATLGEPASLILVSQFCLFRQHKPLGAASVADSLAAPLHWHTGSCWAVSVPKGCLREPLPLPQTLLCPPTKWDVFPLWLRACFARRWELEKRVYL